MIIWHTYSALYRAVNALKLTGMLEGDSEESCSLLIFMLVATWLRAHLKYVAAMYPFTGILLEFICVGCKGKRFLFSVLLFWKGMLRLHEVCAMELLGSPLPPLLLNSDQVLSWIQKIWVNDAARGNENLAVGEENLWKEEGDTEEYILFLKSMVI